jgi:CubicO group peptidase (beta-lactamase class C family)
VRKTRSPLKLGEHDDYVITEGVDPARVGCAFFTVEEEQIMKIRVAWVITLFLLAVITGYSGVQAQEASAYWPAATPEELGIDSAKLAEGLLSIRQQHINIHSLMVIRNGKMVLDAYFYPYDGSTVHDIASDTKSVMTTLIGIATDQGKLSLDDPMVSFFPERTIANRDALKERITVRHLVSMSSGLDCTKEGGEPTLAEMHAAPDWVQFALDRKVVWEPGTRFVYCSPAIHLLSPILQQATGMSASDFARQHLFEPLGIHDFIWPTDPQGYNTGSGDLKLHPHDLAKLGYLWLNHGVWEGKQIVSQQWVENSVKPLLETREGGFYGYGWWVETAETDILPLYRADGRGGQYILVVPSLNLVVTTTGGGFIMDEIGAFLVATLTGADNPLAPNPAGVAQLEAALTTISRPPDAVAAAPLPETASVISGQTFVFEPNSLAIEKLGLEFNDSAEAILNLTLAGGEQVFAWPIALDGVYRLFPGDYDLPMGLRGQWMDDQTFTFEYDEIGNNSHVVLRMRFVGNRVMVESQDISGEGSAQFVGNLQAP